MATSLLIGVCQVPHPHVYTHIPGARQFRRGERQARKPTRKQLLITTRATLSMMRATRMELQLKRTYSISLYRTCIWDDWPHEAHIYHNRKPVPARKAVARPRRAGSKENNKLANVVEAEDDSKLYVASTQ